MLTIQVGQIIEQFQGRIGRQWRITRRAAPTQSGRLRWELELLALCIADDRMLGDVTYATETWLRDNCRDVNLTIDPPCGNGPQYARVLDPSMDDNAVCAEATFTTAEDMIAWMDENLYPEQIGQWWGWNPGTPGPTDEEPPDMTVTMVDGALVWAEP